MAEVDTEHPTSQSSTSEADPLASLHKMSTTAGVGSTDYVAINPMAVTSVIVGIASVAAVMANILLLIPLVGVIFAIIAIRQISNSNGTQTGKGLAVMGLVLSVGIAGYVIAHWVVDTKNYRANVAEIDTLVQKFGGFINTGNYDAAYDLTTRKFKDRVSREFFTDRMKAVQASQLYGRIKGMKSNQLANVRYEESVKLMVAISQVLIDWEKTPYPGREEFRFEKIDGQWLVHDIPSFFPPPPRPGQ